MLPTRTTTGRDTNLSTDGQTLFHLAYLTRRSIIYGASN